MLKAKLMENKNKVIAGAVVALLLATAAVGAFFTDSHSVTNIFTTGGVTSQLTEPQYDAQDPADRQLIGPGKVMVKDPTVTNKDTLDMYTFLKVSVPVKSVRTYDEATKAATAAVLQPLFTWQTNTGWTQVKLVKNQTTWDYYYAYGTAAKMTAVKPGESTSVLFKNSQVKFINVLEGQGLENIQLDMPVTDLSVQTTDLGTENPAEILEIVLNQRG